MLGAAIDKKLCLEVPLTKSYAWSGVRQKSMLGVVLHTLTWQHVLQQRWRQNHWAT